MRELHFAFADAMRVLLCVVALALLTPATYWSLRLAYADFNFRAETSEGARRAVEWSPQNARYHARHASYLDRSGDRRAATAALQTAVRLNPYFADAWIELGLRAEREAEFAQAERCLLKAAEMDRTFQPRWTLANYYFRRNDASRFWAWAQQAAEIGYGDLRPLIRLCWEMMPDSEAILRRLGNDRNLLLHSFLQFLLAENQLDAAGPVARRLLRENRERDTSVLLAYCDRLLWAGSCAVAREVWNSLVASRRVPYPALSPEQGGALTNGRFQFSPTSHGFDWRVDPAGDVFMTRLDAPPGLKIAFSGKQADGVSPLWQFLPLAPGKKYRFRFRYRTSEIAPGAGLRWLVLDGIRSDHLLSESKPLSSEQWSEEEVLFRTPVADRAEMPAARLVLAGAARTEGSIWLRDLTVELTK